MKPNKGLPFS